MGMPDIEPGQKINIKVVKHPTNAGARKTIQRLLNKDVALKPEQRRLERIRETHYSPRRRGGRLYSGRVPKQHLIEGQVGESGTIRATPDVLRDLPGISRFLEINQA